VTFSPVPQVNVTLKKPGTKLEHQGIKIELIGEFGQKKEQKSVFLSLSLAFN
jgi:Vacuolar protein sorting-associated protein 26